MSISLKRYSKIISQSGLITAAELKAFTRTLAPDKQPQTAKDLACALVRSGKLTRFQAATLYEERETRLVLGNYVILDQIGAGGMGQVFKALHRRMQREVALKILLTRFKPSNEAVRRFQREVRTAAALTHPNIVTAYDADEADGTHFLVMEYVAGPNLAEVLRDSGPL